MTLVENLRFAASGSSKFEIGHAAADRIEELERQLAEHKAARLAYASEFPSDVDGEPDVGNIHANIRALKQQLAASADKTAATVQPVNYTVEGVVMTALEYIDYLHDKLSAAPQPQGKNK